jgi:hypothetical protein
MKSILLCAIILLLIGFNCISTEIDSKALLCVPEAPPYSGSQLPNGGPLTKVVVEALHLANINVEIRYAPWARILHDAGNGNCLILGLWSTKQRRDLFHFSTHPIVKQELGLYTINNNFIESKKGILAVERSSYMPDTLKQRAAGLYEVTSIKQGLEMLAKSRVDALYGEMGHINYLLHFNDVFKNKNNISFQTLETKFGFLAISKSTPHAISILKSFDTNIEAAFKQANITDNSWVPVERHD